MSRGAGLSARAVTARQDAPAPATVAPPLSPADALKTFHLPPGYRLELVASEPLVADPVWMDMDPDGRLWVVEMRGYMPNVDGKGEDAPVGQVVVLEDTDDDGRADKRTVFLDGLVQPRTVKVLDHGVLVIAPPQLILARDTDGDLKADTREVLRSDVGVKGGNPEHSPNSLLWALDNWLYTSEYATDFRWTAQRPRERQDAVARPVGHLDGRQRADLPQLERRSAARRLHCPGACWRATRRRCGRAASTSR